MKSKRYEIALSIIGILTVIVTSVGVTFAYFSTSMEGNAGNVNVVTDVLGGVTFDGGADFTTSMDIEPGWRESKTFTITVSPSNYEQTVYVKMDYTNGFRDLIASVDNVSDGAKGNLLLQSPVGEFNENGVVLGDDTDASVTGLVLVEKTFPASDEVQSVTYTLSMELLNKPDVNQNYDQGKEFSATLYAQMANENLYYTNASPNGTPNVPSPSF